MSTREGRVSELISILADAEAELAELTGGEVDAVVDPRNRSPILLRSAQTRLAASEEKLRSVLARCPILVVELSREGTITYANEAVARTSGRDLQDLEGTRWSELIEAGDDAGAERMLAAIFDKGLTNQAILLEAQNGKAHWVEWTTAEPEPETHTNRILLFGLDVSQKRDLLAEQVARAQAEAANKAKSDFLAKMSHELRTPLNAISGYTELMEYGIAGPLNHNQLEYLRRIKLSQMHLLSLIDDVINFAKLEAGKMTLTPTSVRVADLLELCETLTTPQASQRDIDLEFHRFTGPETVWADRDKVEQILVNLVTNAIKFTDPGGSITVHARRTDHRVVFEVADNGCGIPAEKLEAIFQPFVQAENGLTRTRDGVGLGLAISRDLARAMGGDLVVTSAVGTGSCFSLTLPITPVSGR